MKYIICVCGLILGLAISVFAQNDWNSYPARSIADIIAAHSGQPSQISDIMISADPFPSKTKAVYVGKRRPISPRTKDFISFWAQSRNLPASNAEMIAEEFLFKEKDTEYWIPVVKPIAPYLTDELKEGDEIVIYYF